MLKEAPRQIVAGLAASAVFVGLYVGASLVLWLALALSVAVYAGLLIAIPRKKDDEEIELDAGVTQADVKAAVAKCQRAARELRRLSQEPRLADTMHDALRHLAELTEQIADSYTKDARDLRHSRGFVDHHIDQLVEISQTYVSIRRQALTRDAENRLSTIRDAITSYVPQVEAIYHACLENDFKRLELNTQALSAIMQVEAPAHTMDMRN